jgi:hypothetical protein
MRAKTLLFAAALATASAVSFRASAGTPRINFVRTIPPAHDLAPAEQVAVIYAIGDHDSINGFVDEFVGLASRVGPIRIENAVEANKHISDFASLRKEHRADVYLGVQQFTCQGKERTAEGSEHDPDGGRVKKTYQWLDAVCSARIDVLRASDGKKTVSFTVKGEGTSPRAVTLTEDERQVAFLQASHYAAVAAAESITPRVVRESIELDPSAPSFDDGWSMISSNRLTDARAIWQTSLRQHPDSAALSFNLAALNEALSDLTSAGRFFELAEKLSPHEPRYHSALGLFRKRNAVKP